MFERDIGIGKFFVTGREFGSVEVEDSSFKARLLDKGIHVDQVCWMHQTHSNHVEVVDRPTTFPNTDAMITRTPQLLLVTRTADCVPLLMWDLETRTVASVHCGREGFLKGIVQATLERLVDLGCRKKNLHCFLGPHLRAEHHGVSPEIVEKIDDAVADKVIIKRDGKYFFDLTAGVMGVLTHAGVRSKNIEDCGSDTFSSDRYYSYRRMTFDNDPKAKTHRGASGILLKL